MENFIKIPREIINYNFSLEEIGVLTILIDSPNMGKDNIKQWEADALFGGVFSNLLARGIIRVDKSNTGDNILHINLEAEREQEETGITNMNINSALKEIQKNWGIEPELKEYIRELMEEVASSSYYTGYDDRRMEEDAGVFTAYGKSEDFN